MSALFDVPSLLVVLLLFICTTTVGFAPGAPVTTTPPPANADQPNFHLLLSISEA
eukprot:CAMPEP_0119470488 /NCGR_PEP_ID=MMETSP1344-20130328/3372_1 /TAXON_ID=236787 /ORGANISM="Florenciella parvula, Strain CCMP2471" /LENGTH=54 /DNA_ID=CAMNT_0007503175 /DNA_START=8 /DNA_END=172 /DNA_ORIENTATION=-